MIRPRQFLHWRGLIIQAEGVGFEPTVNTRPTTVFETAPINHSGTPPKDMHLCVTGIQPESYFFP